MLLTNELVESESELQVMLHLPPWWNPTLEMSSPAVAATQTTNPVGFSGACTLLIGASGGYRWFLVFLSCIWLPLPLQLRQTIRRRRPTGTKPCTMHIPPCTHKKNFPIYVCRQAPVTFTNHHQIETGCIFTTNIPCRTNGPLSSDWCQSI